MTQQFLPVFLRAGQCSLMRADDLLLVILHLSRSDETLAHSDFVRARHRETLVVKKKCGSRQLLKNSARAPLLEITCGPCVNVVDGTVLWCRFAKNDANDVIRMQRV